jgi:hypothetical protein
LLLSTLVIEGGDDELPAIDAAFPDDSGGDPWRAAAVHVWLGDDAALLNYVRHVLASMAPAEHRMIAARLIGHARLTAAADLLRAAIDDQPHDTLEAALARIDPTATAPLTRPQAIAALESVLREDLGVDLEKAPARARPGGASASTATRSSAASRATTTTSTSPPRSARSTSTPTPPPSQRTSATPRPSARPASREEDGYLWTAASKPFSKAHRPVLHDLIRDCITSARSSAAVTLISRHRA